MILPVNSVHLVITVAPQDSTCPRQCVTQDGTVPSGHHWPNQLHQREANVLLASIVPKEALPPWDVSRASIVMLTWWTVPEVTVLQDTTVAVTHPQINQQELEVRGITQLIILQLWTLFFSV
jgi:hypothetical protein